MSVGPQSLWQDRARTLEEALRHVMLAEPSDHAQGLFRDPATCPWTRTAVSENPQACVWCVGRAALRKASDA